MWDAFVDWFLRLGAAYGVDPIIFGSISVGAIPFFWASVAWLVRNLRHGKPVVLPVLATSLCVLSAYIYLFIAGEGLPLWVYGAVVALVGYSGYSTWQTVRQKTGNPEANASSPPDPIRGEEGVGRDAATAPQQRAAPEPPDRHPSE